MLVHDIQLRQFRNYAHINLNLSASVNLLIGANGQGKTNIVEALYVGALTKSYRPNTDQDLKMFETETASIKLQGTQHDVPLSLELLFNKKGKTAKVNGLVQKKLMNYVGHLHVVLFAPEDLELIKGEPSVRRRFLDTELCQLYPVYAQQLTEYKYVLDNRNKVLKNYLETGKLDDLLLDVLDSQLATIGTLIINRRLSFVTHLQDVAHDIHQRIVQNGERMHLRYETPLLKDALVVDESVYLKHLKHNRSQDLRRGTTTIGPHRDDVIIYINGHIGQKFGSQGQQRTAALAVKLAEISLVYEVKRHYPLLLLDDVLSELDQQRQNHLMTVFENKVQTLITTTDATLAEQFQGCTCYRVEQGHIQVL